MPKDNSEITERPDPLLFRAMKNDRWAMEELFSNYRGRLHRTALRLMGNSDDAEDAVQDGLLSAYLNLSRFEGRSQFSTWITAIVLNAALMHLRRKRSMATISFNPYLDGSSPPLASWMRDPAPNPEEMCERNERVQIFRQVLQNLPPVYRKPLWLCEVQGMKYREAAEALGVPIGSFKAQLYRARRILRKEISVAEHSPRLFRMSHSNVTS